jgi:hypothetical protein
MSNEDNPYPHWKEALFGENGHASNAYCAVKYGIWHVSHVLLAGAMLCGLGMLLLVQGSFQLVQRVANIEIPDMLKIGAIPRFRAAMNSKYGKRLMRHLSYLALITLLVILLAFIIYVLIVDTLVAVASILTVIVPIILIWIDGKYQLYQHFVPAKKVAVKKSSNVKDRSTETPYLRRVLGYCPVHMDIDPKWYRSFDEKMVEWIEYIEAENENS